MKKLFSLFLILLFVCNLVGCCDEKQNENFADVPTIIVDEISEQEENDTFETYSRYKNLTDFQKKNIESFDMLSCADMLTDEEFMTNYEYYPVFENGLPTGVYYLHNSLLPMLDTTQQALYEFCTWYEVNYYIILGLIEELSIFDNDYINIERNTIGYFQLLNENVVYDGVNLDVSVPNINIWLGVEDYANYRYNAETDEEALRYYAEAHNYDDDFVGRVMQYANAWGYSYETNQYNEYFKQPFVIAG